MSTSLATRLPGRTVLPRAAHVCAAAVFCGAALLATVAGCGQDPSLLIRITADAPVEQYDLYIREDATGEVIFHSGFNPVLAPGEKSDTGIRDLTVDDLKIAVKLSQGGKFTLLIVGVVGELDGGKPSGTATQLFWAGHVVVDGANRVDARLLTVPAGDDADRDLWPDVTDFPAHVPEAAMMYAGQLDLLDCNDKTDMPLAPGGMNINLRADEINPFAREICNDGYDENCNGSNDEPCVDKDGDGNPRGSDCDDNDPARHKPNPNDPFPDPPNCCGYSLGKAGTPEEHTSFAGDPLLCPTQRCGDGIDQSCRGNAQNDATNDTACVVDADCDGYPAAPQGDDCDDTDPNVHPGALEVCGNGKNESCAAAGPDSGCVPCDLDGDTYQRDDAAANCPDMTNQHPGVFDCNDNDAGVYPGSASVAGNKEGGINAQGRVATALKGLCRRIYENVGIAGTPKIPIVGYSVGDADCNGTAYEACPPASCDIDGDGWPANDCGIGLTGPFDCNDNDPTVFPSAPDKCGDGVDGACAGADTPCAGMDKDGDGYLPPADCDDSNPSVHPFAVEKCNGIDDDCDGDKDEGNPDPDGVPLVSLGATATCTDDNDGECAKQLGRCVCSPTTPVASRDDPARRTLCSGELTPSGRNPHCFGAGQPKKQSCGDTLNVDDDCDGRFDDPTGTNLAVKGMPCGLTFGVCKPGVVVGCVATPSKTWFGGSPPAGKSHWECSSDTIPAALSETCNGFDDDCDNVVPANEIDTDMDQYISCGTYPCAGPFAGMITNCGDCNEGVATTHPNAMEKCDNIDNNCANGIADDGGTDPACTGKTCCSSQSTCRDLQNGDPLHCNGCNTSCNTRPGAGAGQPADNCVNGGCACGGGAACGAGSWCSGGCQTCNQKAHCGPGCTPCPGALVCTSEVVGCNQCNVDADCAGQTSANPGSILCDANNCYCVGGTCEERKPPGGPCTVTDATMPDNECLGTQYCADGVCCNVPQAMCGGCMQCDKSGSAGTCTATNLGQPPRSGHTACASMSLANCERGNCNGQGTCDVIDDQPCSGSICTDVATVDSHTSVRWCQLQTANPYDTSCDNTTEQATSICVTPGNTRVICANATTCRTNCTQDSHCVQVGGALYTCWESTGGGDGRCYAGKSAGDVCTSNAECNSGACVCDSVACAQRRCCGMGSRPTGANTCGPTPMNDLGTICGSNTLSTPVCRAASNYMNCNNPIATSPCGNSGGTATLPCANVNTCVASCQCTGGTGTAPCSNPAQMSNLANCLSGNRCVNEGDASCSACTVLAFCGSSCTACTPMCTGQNTISGDACTGGTMCAASHSCPNNRACTANACLGDCANDGDCQNGYWCKSGTPSTCVLRGTNGSMSACDEAECKGAVGGTTCNQCADADHVTNLTACGADKKC